MLWALIRKDMGLLRGYLLAAVVATLSTYVAGATMTMLISQYQDAAAQRLTPRAFVTLQFGSNSGYAFTAFSQPCSRAVSSRLNAAIARLSSSLASRRRVGRT